jgi:hypothetical protein
MSPELDTVQAPILLPFEIWRMILETMEIDSLLPLALVCRDLRPIAYERYFRGRLWKDIIIFNRPASSLSSLDSPLDYINALILTQNESTNLIDILPKLPKLKHLGIEQNAKRVAESFYDLRHLQLGKVRFDLVPPYELLYLMTPVEILVFNADFSRVDSESQISFLTALTKLKDLKELRFIRSFPIEIMQPNFASLRSLVKVLTIFGQGNAGMLESLSDENHPAMTSKEDFFPNVHSLHLFSFTLTHLPVFRRLIERLDISRLWLFQCTLNLLHHRDGLNLKELVLKYFLNATGNSDIEIIGTGDDLWSLVNFLKAVPRRDFREYWNSESVNLASMIRVCTNHNAS